MNVLTLTLKYISCLLSLVNFFQEEKVPNLITSTSIGEIEICQPIDSIQLKVIGDTTTQGDGFVFYGKYLGEVGSEILVDISISDSNTVTRLSTKSKSFKTVKGVRVGSSLNDFIASDREIQLKIIYSEYNDVYLFKHYPDSRIEYRFGNRFNELLKSYHLKDEPTRFLDLNEIENKLSQVGDSIFVKEITVVKTGRCD